MSSGSSSCSTCCNKRRPWSYRLPASAKTLEPVLPPNRCGAGHRAARQLLKSRPQPRQRWLERPPRLTAKASGQGKTASRPKTCVKLPAKAATLTVLRKLTINPGAVACLQRTCLNSTGADTPQTPTRARWRSHKRSCCELKSTNPQSVHSARQR